MSDKNLAEDSLGDQVYALRRGRVPQSEKYTFKTGKMDQAIREQMNTYLHRKSMDNVPPSIAPKIRTGFLGSLEDPFAGCQEFDNINAQLEIPIGYETLFDVLQDALHQASKGKGVERHAKHAEEPFINQKICEITRRVGLGYPLGQAIKKAEESIILGGERGVAELLGAINYLAAAVLIFREQMEDSQ